MSNIYSVIEILNTIAISMVFYAKGDYAQRQILEATNSMPGTEQAHRVL